MEARKHGEDHELAGFPALGGLIRRMEAAGAAVRERRVADLTRPGPVLIRLGARGFGITLPPRPEPGTAQPS